MARPGHPTSLVVARCIESLRDALYREYGTDYAFSVHGKAHLLGFAHGDNIVEAVTTEHDNPRAAPLWPAWLPEAVLSMEHDHNPAVRYCGDQLRKRMEGK